MKKEEEFKLERIYDLLAFIRDMEYEAESLLRLVEDEDKPISLEREQKISDELLQGLVAIEHTLEALDYVASKDIK